MTDDFNVTRPKNRVKRRCNPRRVTIIIMYYCTYTDLCCMHSDREPETIYYMYLSADLLQTVIFKSIPTSHLNHLFNLKYIYIVIFDRITLKKLY